jgi:hypothetical protein
VEYHCGSSSHLVDARVRPCDGQASTSLLNRLFVQDRLPAIE